MRRDELEGWAADAADMLDAYRTYAEGLRAIGRGMTPPAGKQGHTVEQVIEALRGAAEIGPCFLCGEPTPGELCPDCAAKPVTLTLPARFPERTP